MTSTRSRSSCRAIRTFSSRFMLQPGDCSPSRSVVSKIWIDLAHGSSLCYSTDFLRGAASLRTHDISSSNCAGRSDWAPSENASSGWGCTSTISPSAPAAIAALAIGTTSERTPVPWLGIDDDREMAQLMERGDRREIARVARVVLERPDPALAEDDVVVPLRHDVLGRHQEVLQGAGHPALQQDRALRTFPTSFRRAKFCMLRAPICRMSAYSATSRDIRRRDDFGDDDRARSVPAPRPGA